MAGTSRRGTRRPGGLSSGSEARSPGAPEVSEAPAPLLGWEGWGVPGGRLSAPAACLRPPPTCSVDLGPASPGRSSRGSLLESPGLPCSGSRSLRPPRPRPLRVVKLGPGLGFPQGAGPAAPGLLLRSGIENEGGRTALPPPPPKMGMEESYKQQAAYIKIDILQVRGHRRANAFAPAPGETSPTVRSLFAHIHLQLRCAHHRACGLGRAGRVRGRDRAARQRPPPPAAEPASSPAAAGTQVGARVRGSAGCEAVCDGRECARRRVHERCARRLTLRSPEPAPRTRTGPLQLPRAMILWKQKLKVGGNNGGPIGCNLGQARTC